MKIAIIGVRGIPVVYSGFETFAEELSCRLVERGHEVTVYGRRGYVEEGRREWKGVKLITLPSVRSKHLETILHSLLASIDVCIRREVQAVYYLGVGSSVVSFLPRFFGIKTMVNVDGLDFKREKWGKLAQGYLKLAERLALWCPSTTLTDSRFVQKYYREKYGRKIEMIPYGYDERRGKAGAKYWRGKGFKRGKYLVWTGRMVPDNHVDELLRAYREVKQDKYELVVVGGDRHETEYGKTVRKLARGDRKIKFLGWLGREEYAEVVRGAYAYVETKRSGGTHPSLVEAMGYGQLIVANDYGGTREVLGEEGVYYRSGDVSDLRKVLKRVMGGEFEKKREEYGRRAQARAKQRYSWGAVVRGYEDLFGKVLSGGS